MARKNAVFATFAFAQLATALVEACDATYEASFDFHFASTCPRAYPGL
jgi:hypothetical protein